MSSRDNAVSSDFGFTSRSEVFELVALSKTEARPSAVQLSWQNITCRTTTNGVTSSLLEGVSGSANPGEILAIMGPSGSGKTTLLNLLAGRTLSIANASSDGGIFANGQAISSFAYQRHAGYVTQADILLPELTPREALMFSLNMRTTYSLAEKTDRVEAMLKLLKLEKVADNRIGDVLHKGISGGERKRVCIGVELVVKPSVLLLDEPTSGMDSTTAEVLIDILKDAASTGMAVIMTIHQPSKRIFRSFDRLILMTDGKFVYQGPSAGARGYLNAIGYPCPRLINPPDYFMKILNIENKAGKTDEEVSRISELTEAYASHPEMEELMAPRHTLVPISDLDESPLPSSTYRFGLLFRRCVTTSFRNTMALKTKIMQVIIIGILVVLTFSWLDDGLGGLQSRAGALFFISANEVMLENQNAALVCKSYLVLSDKALFMKEYKQRLYSPTAFLWAKMASNLFFELLLPTLTSFIVYWSIGLNNESPEKFVNFCETYLGICMCLLSMAGSSPGFLSGTLFDDLATAMASAPLIMTPMFLFCGFFANSDSTWSAFAWLKYVSPFYYGFTILVVNDFTGLSLEGPGLELLKLDDENLNFLFLQFVGLIIVLRLLNWALLVVKSSKF